MAYLERTDVPLLPEDMVLIDTGRGMQWFIVIPLDHDDEVDEGYFWCQDPEGGEHQFRNDQIDIIDRIPKIVVHPKRRVQSEWVGQSGSPCI